MGSDYQAPFDAVASDYDRTFTDTAIGRIQRDLVWEQLAAMFSAGDRVLELGCGTGEDAVWMAGRGVDVVATDASNTMLEQAEVKARTAGVTDRVTFQQLDLSRVSEIIRPNGAAFDGVLSNFGALNCIDDRRPLARALAEVVRPGGRVVLVIMGRLCLWEVFWFMLRLRPRSAFRRWSRDLPAGIGDGHSVPVWYPSASFVKREFAGCFSHVGTRAVGALVPTPDLAPLLGNRPRILRLLAGVERSLAPALAWMADHYLICFERKIDD